MMQLLEPLGVALAFQVAGGILGALAALLILGPRRFRERLRELKP